MGPPEICRKRVPSITGPFLMLYHTKLAQEEHHVCSEGDGPDYPSGDRYLLCDWITASGRGVEVSTFCWTSEHGQVLEEALRWCASYRVVHNITSVTDVAEQCALAIIVRLAGSFVPHQASGPQVGVLRHLRNEHFFDFSYFCFDGIVLQLNWVQHGSKSFAYATILCNIMYERVVLLRPVVAVPIGGPREPRMRRWASVMPCGGGGMVGRYWNDTMEVWFEANLQVFFPYPYTGMDFQGDLDIGLPFDYVWGPAGMCYISAFT